MDIMDSTDTPTGGLDGSTASRGELPLSVDQRDAFASPTNASRSGGSQPTHSSSFSTSSSAFDRLDYVNNTTGGDHIDQDLPNALPTSTDDVMMPTTEYASHPSLLSSETASLLPSASSSTPTSSSSMKESVKEGASDMKARAESMKESVKEGASEAKAKAESMTESMKESMKEGASEAQAKAASLAESAKSSMSQLKDSVSSGLHTAEDKVEGAYHELKKDVAAHMPHSTPAPAPTPVRSTAIAEPTDTHPLAASMRDTHLHPGLVSLPTHSNETPSTSAPHISAKHQAALEAAANTEPKDPTASSGVMGALSSLHSKLEEGAERVKEKVDNWAEQHLRSEQKPSEHLSEAHVRDLPTLVDGSNEKNTENVRARLHPSGVRAGQTAQFETEDVIDSI